MGKNPNQPNQQQMGNKGGFQQKQPGKENLNPGQRPQQNDRNLKTPMGGHGQGQQQKQPFIKKEDQWDKNK